MMSRYDEILQIFECQKLEILKLSDKVNELEETNAFLMTILEKSKTLPPVYDPNLLRKDKAAAIQREISLNTIRRNSSHIDSTHCETTLNDSFDGNLLTNNNITNNSLRWSNDSTIANVKLTSSPKAVKLESNDSLKLIGNSWIGGDEKINNNENLNGNSNEMQVKQTNKNPKLRISNSSPIRRESLLHKSVGLCNNDDEQIMIHRSNEYSSSSTTDNRTSNSGEEIGHGQDFLDSVIIRSVEDLISEAENTHFSNMNGKFNICPKSNGSPSPSKSLNQSSSLTSTVIPRTSEKENIQALLDNLIDTLQTTNKAYSSQESNENFKSFNYSESFYSEYMNKLIIQKNQYVSNTDNKHTQMKLLLTAQQLQADLLHKSLEENNKIIFKNCNNFTQNMPSNAPLNSVEKDTHAHVNEILQIDLKKVPVSSVDVKLHRQKELSRINSKFTDKILESPKIQNGFVKFTALIKGYIVRTLRETDKVQNIILTIKDTAQLAIKLRQERLSGDSSHIDDPNSYNAVSRRNNHEIISFQQRLVSQLKTALGELHEIFFEWPSTLKMRLIRHHINQLMSSTSNNLQSDYDNGNSIPATANYSSPRAAKLSSATLKRRQKLALRRSEGNFKHEIFKSGNNNKENGIKNSISSASHRKPIYSSPYGCRGYGTGPNSRATNIQSKIINDRKSRTNTVSRRRGATRTITKFDINKITESPQPNPAPVTNQQVKTSESEVPKIQTIPSKSEEISNNQSHQQQSQLQSQLKPHNSKKQSQKHDDSNSKFNQQSQPPLQSQAPKHSQNWIQPKTITTSVCSHSSNNFVPFAKNLQKHMFIVRNTNPTNASKADGDSLEDSSNHNKMPTSDFSSNSRYTQGNINNYSDECDWKTQTYTLSSNDTLADGNLKHDMSPGMLSNKCLYTEDTSNKSCLSDFNENSFSRVEVDVNDTDIGYLCQNNSSYYSESNDPTESQSVVFVDVLSQNYTKETNMNKNLKKPITESTNSNSSNKSNKRNFSFQKLIKPNANNVVISNALNYPKPDFYFPTNNNDDILPLSSQFRIRKRIVAANNLHSSTVSHS